MPGKKPRAKPMPEGANTSIDAIAILTADKKAMNKPTVNAAHARKTAVLWIYLFMKYPKIFWSIAPKNSSNHCIIEAFRKQFHVQKIGT